MASGVGELKKALYTLEFLNLITLSIVLSFLAIINGVTTHPSNVWQYGNHNNARYKCGNHVLFITI